jgi:hypothetical protein
VEVLATDIGADAPDAQHWAEINAHAASRDSLFRHEMLDRATFERLVRFRPADMRDLSGLPAGGFDFVWSSCALEHLGSLRHGMDFVLAAMALLKPGGWAVHTTEYNVASNSATIVEGPSVIYRRLDIEALEHRLRRAGCGLERVDFDAGSEPADLDFDEFPYFTRGRHHIKLLLDGHITTSMMLVIRKGLAGVSAPEPVPPPPAVVPAVQPVSFWAALAQGLLRR